MGFLDQLKDTIDNLQKNIKRFDPTTLNDDVAMKTEWTRAKDGGASRQIYEFVQEASHKLEIKVKASSYLFPIIFTLAGFIPMIMGVIFYFKFQDWKIALFMIPFGFTFIAVGVFTFLSYKKSHFFDKSNGYYWKGKEGAVDSAKHKCRLIDIHALQIIQEHIVRNSNSSSGSSGQTSYTSYELNLVLKDGKRFNVLDHAGKQLLMEEAEKVSQFLGGKPVWDGTYF